MQFKKDSSAADKAGVIQDLQTKGGEVIKDENINSSSESRLGLLHMCVATAILFYVRDSRGVR